MNKFKENYFSMTRTSHLTRMFLFEKVFFFISSSIDVSKQQSPEKEREGGGEGEGELGTTISFVIKNDNKGYRGGRKKREQGKKGGREKRNFNILANLVFR